MARRRSPKQAPPVEAPAPAVEEAEEEIVVLEEDEDEHHHHEPADGEDDINLEPDFGEEPGAPLRSALWRRGQAFMELLLAGQEELSEEGLHELRVASRRLQATLELVGELIGEQPIRKLCRTLRKARKALSALRDVQVQLHTAGPDETLAEFREHMESQLQNLNRKARKRLKKIKVDPIEKRLEVVDGLIAALSESNEAWAECQTVLNSSVSSCLEQAVQVQHELDVDRTETVHPLRLALKTFRYQAEVMAEIGIAPMSSEQWEGLKALHNATGRMQDLEVLTQHLDCFWAAYPPIRHEQLKVLGRLLRERNGAKGPVEDPQLDLRSLWPRLQPE